MCIFNSLVLLRWHRSLRYWQLTLYFGNFGEKPECYITEFYDIIKHSWTKYAIQMGSLGLEQSIYQQIIQVWCLNWEILI